jgi:hypothetical protein
MCAREAELKRAVPVSKRRARAEQRVHAMWARETKRSVGNKEVRDTSKRGRPDARIHPNAKC